VFDSISILDLFLRGVAAGAMLLLGLSALRSGVGRDHRIALLLASTSIICWLISESPTLWPAFGRAYVLVVPAFAVSACFWVFSRTVFEDRPLTPLGLSPIAVQISLGFLAGLERPFGDWAWSVLNGVSGLLALHAFLIIARGWSGDLIEGRRKLRGPLLALSALYAICSVVFGFAARLDPTGPWLEFTGGRPLGGAFIAVLIVGIAFMFLQARTSLFGTSRRPAPAADTRIEAAEQVLLGKLNALMAADERA
jgi:hypothetical protein